MSRISLIIVNFTLYYQIVVFL